MHRVLNEDKKEKGDRTDQLSHTLLRLRLAHDVDSEVGEMRSEIRIYLGIVAGVAVDVWFNDEKEKENVSSKRRDLQSERERKTYQLFPQP